MERLGDHSGTNGEKRGEKTRRWAVQGVGGQSTRQDTNAISEVQKKPEPTADRKGMPGNVQGGERQGAAAWWRAEPNTSDCARQVSDRIKLKMYTQPSTIYEKCASTGWVKRGRWANISLLIKTTGAQVCSPVVEHTFRMSEALGAIPKWRERREKKWGRGRLEWIY